MKDNVPDNNFIGNNIFLQTWRSNLEELVKACLKSKLNFCFVTNIPLTLFIFFNLLTGSFNIIDHVFTWVESHWEDSSLWYSFNFHITLYTTFTKQFSLLFSLCLIVICTLNEFIKEGIKTTQQPIFQNWVYCSKISVLTLSSLICKQASGVGIIISYFHTKQCNVHCLSCLNRQMAKLFIYAMGLLGCHSCCLHHTCICGITTTH